LDRAANKYDADTLRRYIRNPKSVDPASPMPPQPSITDIQLDAIVNFLTGLPKTTNNASPEHH
jgi:cytochrome c1